MSFNEGLYNRGDGPMNSGTFLVVLLVLYWWVGHVIKTIAVITKAWVLFSLKSFLKYNMRMTI